MKHGTREKKSHFTLLARSNSGRNNVEVIEYTTSITGRHKARIELIDFVKMSVNEQVENFMQVGIAYRIVVRK